MAEFQLRATGPDRYCPDCGRWLVKVKEGGTFDLAGEAQISQHAVIEPGTDGPVEALITEAVCLRCHPEEDTSPFDWQNLDQDFRVRLRDRLPNG